MADKQLNRDSDAQAKFAVDVRLVVGELEDMLLAKNRKYGDAALNPRRIFSKASPSELIKVRLDDKISRIAAAQTDEDEDPYWDMLGYLVLYRIAKKREAESSFPLLEDKTKANAQSEREQFERGN